MNKILAPIDFGETSPTVLRFAFGIAAVMDAEVAVIHVHQIIDDPHYRDLTDEAVAAIQKRLDDLIAEVGDSARFRTYVTSSARRDFTTPGILEAAAEADLVVMGQTESRGIWRFMLGDTTSEVLDGVTCPVLVVPAGATFKVPRTITLTLDEAVPDRALTAPLRELTAAFDATVAVHQVLAMGERGDRAAVRESLAGVASTYHGNHTHGSLPDYLTVNRRQLADTWLCLYHRCRPSWLRSVMNDPAERVAAVAPLPVLVLTDLPGPAPHPIRDVADASLN